MFRCPKCSSSEITGPFYRSNWKGESLLYHCRCGYEESKPVHDAEDNKSNLSKSTIPPSFDD